MITRDDAKKKLNKIMQNAMGDDLERCESAFRGLNLDEKHGNSGKTRRQILEEYRNERALWRAAVALTKEIS